MKKRKVVRNRPYQPSDPHMRGIGETREIVVGISPAELEERIKTNFYPISEELPIMISEGTVWASIQGGAGSGKHAISRQVDRLLVENVGENALTEERLIKEGEFYSLKRQLQDTAYLFSKYNVNLGIIGNYTQNLERTSQPEILWSINTMGFKNIFTTAVMTHGRERLWNYIINNRSLRNLLIHSLSLEGIVRSIPEQMLEEAFKEIAYAYQSSLEGLSDALLDVPIPITFLANRRPSRAIADIKKGGSERVDPRHVFNFTKEDLMLMRLVDTVFLYKFPEVFYEINAEDHSLSKDSDFAVNWAKYIIRKSQEILTEHGGKPRIRIDV